MSSPGVEEASDVSARFPTVVTALSSCHSILCLQPSVDLFRIPSLRPWLPLVPECRQSFGSGCSVRNLGSPVRKVCSSSRRSAYRQFLVTTELALEIALNPSRSKSLDPRALFLWRSSLFSALPPLSLPPLYKYSPRKRHA